jgi:hypothetical protein
VQGISQVSVKMRYTKFKLQNPTERNHLGDLDTDKRLT